MDPSDEKRAALKAFIKNRGIKPTRWAEDAGLSRSLVVSYLGGHARTMTMESAEKLAAAAGVTVAEMFGAVNAPLTSDPLPSESAETTGGLDKVSVTDFLQANSALWLEIGSLTAKLEAMQNELEELRGEATPARPRKGRSVM